MKKERKVVGRERMMGKFVGKKRENGRLIRK